MLKLINSVVLGNGISVSEVVDIDTGVSYLIGYNHDGGMISQTMVDKNGKIKWNEKIVRENIRENWCNLSESLEKESEGEKQNEEYYEVMNITEKPSWKINVNRIKGKVVEGIIEVIDRMNEVRT